MMNIEHWDIHIMNIEYQDTHIIDYTTTVKNESYSYNINK